MLKNLIIASATLPTPRGWLSIGALVGVEAALVHQFGTRSGFLRVDAAANENNPGKLVNAAMATFVFPCFFEEAFWRATLCPDPRIGWRLFWPSATIVLAAHVVSHPVAGCTIWPRGRHVFMDWRFLTCATIVLGSSTLGFYLSSGSLLGAIIPHWVAVFVWKEWYGGETLLGAARA